MTTTLFSVGAKTGNANRLRAFSTAVATTFAP